MNSRLARRYAKALLALAKEARVLDATSADLATIDLAFQDDRLRALLASPLVDATKRTAIVREIANALKVSGLVANFTSLLAERDRLLALPDIHRSFGDMLDAELGRTRGQIRTAVPLAEGQELELAELAKRLAGGREVVLTASVDPDLLGGVVLDIGGTVYDGSVRTQLSRLSKNMTEGGA
jgi:F-type H+-transporting ATPase subunit delta